MRDVDGAPAPSRNDEYLFYQTLVGMWPLEKQNEEQHADLVMRLQRCMEKSTREAKAHTSWVNPNVTYDEAVRDFVAKSLALRDNNRFLAELSAFVDGVVNFGLYNSLTQTTLKIMSPGVPDIYQGQELWDFSLVDPDNRRPVDFNLRRQLLRELQDIADRGLEHQQRLAAELAANPRDLRTKLFVTWKALQFRKQHHDLIMSGQYVPVAAIGERQEHVCAFAWNLERSGAPRKTALVVVPRWTAKLLDSVQPNPRTPLGPEVWRDTRLAIPLPLPPHMKNLFTGQGVGIDASSSLLVSDALALFPWPCCTRPRVSVLPHNRFQMTPRIRHVRMVKKMERCAATHPRPVTARRAMVNETEWLSDAPASICDPILPRTYRLTVCATPAGQPASHSSR